MPSYFFKHHINYLSMWANTSPGRFKIEPKGIAMTGRDNTEADTYGYSAVHVSEFLCLL